MIQQWYDVDLIPRRERLIVDVSQGDGSTRKLSFRLWERNTRFTIPAGITAMFVGVKPDKNGIAASMTIEDNAVHVMTSSQMTAVSGLSKYDIILSQNGDLLYSTTVELRVQPMAAGEETEYSDSDLSLIQQAIESAGEIMGEVQSAKDAAASAQESEQKASTSASAASDSASAAARSESSARESAAAAESSEQRASTDASKAAASASDADSSAASARDSKTAAENSASAAAARASEASSSAREAAESVEESKSILETLKETYSVDDHLDPSSTHLVENRAVAQAIAQIASDNADMLDSVYTSMLDGTNTSVLFPQWYAQASQSETDRYVLLSRWAVMMQNSCGDKQYTLRSYLETVSGETAMTPLDDLEGMSAAQLCTDETTAVADWADEDQIGGWYIRANALSLQNGHMNIIAIEGIDSAFDLTGETAPVYVFTPSLWYREWEDENYNYKSYRGLQDAQKLYRPFASDVDFEDNSKRALHWEPAFCGSLTESGALTSGAGNAPANYRSASTGISDARKMTAYEGLWNDCDTDYLLRMWQLRHFNLENSNILEGCTSYNYQYLVAAAETDVKRVLLSVANAANIEVGSNVAVGDPGSNTSFDRSNAYMRNIVYPAKVISKETVNVDGTEMVAVNLDIASAITTTATTRVSTMPWHSGSTEALPGHKDGSIRSLTSGRFPARVMGIEVLNGAYCIGLDPLYQVTTGSDGVSNHWDYAVHECRDSEKLASNITTNYHDTGIRYLNMPNGWQYVKGFALNVLGIVMPRLIGGSSTTYFKSAFYGASSAGVRAPWRFGALNNGASAGIACEHGANAPGNTNWNGEPRLSGSGKKRGEWQA